MEQQDDSSNTTPIACHSKILSLLSARERGTIFYNNNSVGDNNNKNVFVGKRGKGGYYYRSSMSSSLSYSVPWNATRMQNMILAIGPGTPASTILTHHDNSDDDDDDEHSFPHSLEEEDEDDESLEDIISTSNDDDDENEEEEDVRRRSRRQRWMRRIVLPTSSGSGRSRRRRAAAAFAAALEENENQEEGERVVVIGGTRRRRIAATTSSHGHDDDDDEDSDDDDDEEEERWHHQPSSSSASNNRIPTTSTNTPKKVYRGVPSMRHGGCINTASWLSSSWHLSTVSSSSHSLHSFINSSSQSANNNATKIKAVKTEEECPTQLLTSGDDRIIKFWDVSLSMGTVSPVQGGMDTITPFSSSSNNNKHVSSSYTHNEDDDDDDDDEEENIVKSWRKKYKQGNTTTAPSLPGIVTPLLSLQTNHRGNVFHATPIPQSPGKIVTCAADGYLRLADVELNCIPSSSTATVGVGRNPRNSSNHNNSSSNPPTSIIISPEYDDDENSSRNNNNNSLPARLLSLRPSMCFSHHLLNANVGLLCSERGLRKFDLRLSPRSQLSRSVLGGPYRTCKACAIWNVDGGKSGGDGEMDSAYVFAGGSSGDVALYDLRMTDGTSSRIIQHYRPKNLSLSNNNASVSVSGLDVSKDKRELLVSYENDQIYTFPIFPKSSCAAGPTLEELSSYSTTINHEEQKTADESSLSSPSNLLPELAAYGGHLNRYTFLKMAKYAGPNDEYICTGSDSGHAWIYERATGAVVSLLKADNSTCNGVVPHPSLPFFVTYGIDSTAKLWRATLPVGGDVDDSPLGRHKSSQEAEYEKSPIIRQWKSIQNKITTLGDFEDESLSFFPDNVPTRDDDFDDSVFGGLAGVLFRSSRFGINVPGGPYIGNDLRNLPYVLRQNYYACARALVAGDDEPVRSGLDGLKRRISLIRLRHQADQLGLVWDPSNPWMMRPKEHLLAESEDDNASKEGETEIDLKAKIKLEATKYGNHADLVPDHPGDWIPYDPDMTSKPKPCGIDFNTSEYGGFLAERYGSHIVQNSQEAEKVGATEKDVAPGANDKMKETEQEESSSACDGDKEMMKDDDKTKKDTSDVGAEVENLEVASQGGDKMEVTSASLHNGDTKVEEEEEDLNCEADFSKQPWEVLLETVLLLKESGNAAVQAGAINVAARRYDKAIQYCAVAFTEFPVGDVEFLAPHQVEMMSNGGHEIHWSPLLRALITIRLNLSMTLLKKDIHDPTAALDQAHLALNELKPFTSAKGKVMAGWKLDKAHEGEHHQTYKEAKELQAKAYFRLGSAQLSSSDFAAAVRSFEHSIRSTREATPGGEPEPVVIRRLAEAKRENLRKKKRHRKKFKFMFSSEEGGENGGAGGAEGKEG